MNRYIVSIFGTAFRFLLSLAISAQLVRYLGIEEYGQYGLIIFYATTIMLFLDFNISQCLFSRLNTGYINNYDLYIILYSSVFMVLATFLTLYTFLAVGFLKQVSVLSVTIVSCMCFVSIRIWNILKFILESDKRTTKLQIIQTSVLASISVSLLTLKPDEKETVLCITLIVWGSIIIFPLVRSLKHLHLERGDSNTLKHYLDFCSPLILPGLLGVFVSLSDRFFLERWYTYADVGALNISKQIINSGLVIVTATQTVFWQLVGSDDAASGRKRLGTQLVVLCAVNLVVMTILSINFDVIIVMLFTEQIVEYKLAIIILLFSVVFTTINQILGTYFLSKSRTKPIAIANFFSGVFMVLLLYLLLNPNFGIEAGLLGVALTSIALQCVASFVLLTFLLLRHELEKSDFYKLLFISAVAVMIVGIYLIDTARGSLSVTDILNTYLSRQN